MNTSDNIDTVDAAILILAGSGKTAKKLQASRVLHMTALNLLSRPRLKRQFAMKALAVLMKDVLNYRERRKGALALIEQNLLVIGLLGNESVNQLSSLLKLYRKLKQGRNSKQKKTAMDSIEHAIREIYTDAVPYLSERLRRPIVNTPRRTKAVIAFGSLLEFWGCESYDEKICRKIVSELEYTISNDPSPGVRAEAMRAVCTTIQSPLITDSRLRLNLVKSIARQLSMPHSVGQRSRKRTRRSFVLQTLKQFTPVLTKDMEKLLRFYISEKQLFRRVQNRVEFIRFIRAIAIEAGNNKTEKSLPKNYVVRIVNQLERLRSIEDVRQAESQPLAQTRVALLRLLD